MDKNSSYSDIKQVYNQEFISLSKIAKSYTKCNLSVLPIKDDKRPAVPSWKQYQETIIKHNDIDILFSKPKVKGIGVVCGSVSDNLEVIDVDCKNDKSGELWIKYSSLIMDCDPILFKKLIIAKTINGGYHLYYRCDQISGNTQLAKNLNHNVLIETRGQGGYVVAPPTNNYEFIQGDFLDIPIINEKERSLLLSIAKSFDESELIVPKKFNGNHLYTNHSPFDAYNQQGNVIELLENHGWRKVKMNGERIHFKRP